MNNKTKNSLTAGLMLSTAVLGVYASKGYVSADETANTPTTEVVADAPKTETTTEVPKTDSTTTVEAPKTEEASKVEEPKTDETPKTEETPKAEESPKVEDKPKTEETPKVEETPEAEEEPKEETPKEDEKPKEETPKADGPTFDFVLGGRDESITDTPSKLDLGEELGFENTTKTKGVTYKQVTSTGVSFDLSDSKIKPVTSKLVAVYKDDKGEEREVTVAEITGTKTYNLDVSYSNFGNSVTYTFDKNSLLKDDSYASTYRVLLDGTEVQNFNSTEDEFTGLINLVNKLAVGSHTVEITGLSKYGVVTSGKVDIVIPKEEEPVTSTPIPTPTPTPTPLPNTDNSGNTGGENVPLNPTPGTGGTTGNAGENVPLTPTPDKGNVGGLLPTPDKPTKPVDVDPTPQPETPKDPAKGVEDVKIGGVSIYGDALKSNGVASNGDTTTFTDSKKVDVRVQLDTSVVDSSRTVLKLVGREQGEIGASQFVELKDGVYRIKGIAKDDFYTLTIKAYDKNGNLVTDTIETFSVNKGGSKYSISNKGLMGTSVKELSSDLKILETNVDKIKSDSTVVRVYLNGKLVELPKGAVKVSRSGGVSGKWEYTYTINKGKFKDEGVYTVEIYSESETGVNYNSTDKTIQFTVDRSPAEISVSGIRTNGRYKSASKRVTIDIRDISDLKSVKAFLNGKEVELEYDKETGLYYYDMKSSGKGKNEFVVEVEDAAGNVSTETVDGFYLSEDLAFSIFNDNNLYWILGGIATATAGFLAFVAFRRKRKLDEEDRLALEQAELLAASASSGNSASTQVEEFPEGGEGTRFNIEEVLPSSGEVLSVSTEEVEDQEEPDSETAEDVESTDVLVEDEDFSEDEQKTDVIEEPLEEDDQKTDVINEEDDLASEDEQKTDIIEEDEVSEDSKPTDVVED